MDHSEYREHDGVALAGLIKDGTVTAAEVLDAAIARAEAVNGEINAITQFARDAARGRAREEMSGALAGVPFLLKDLHQDWDTLPPAGGMSVAARPATSRTSVVVQRWLDAGLVVFGRTNTPEFGAKGITEPDAFGAARNPWNPGRTTGGSSGGAAAAVAAGIVPVAGASDGGGSIRIPASCCGLFGLKPSRGLVPAGPDRGENWHGASLDGVVSRTVRDSAVALDAVVGPDPAGPYLTARPPLPFAEEIQREPGTLRIGVNSESALGEPHPQAVVAVERTRELLESLGHEVELVDSPVDVETVAIDFLNGWAVRLAAAIDERVAATGARRKDFELDSRLLAAAGRATSGPEYIEFVERWHTHAAALARFHENYDLLLTPTVATPPWPVGMLRTPRALRIAGRVALALRLGGLMRSSGMVDRVARENLRHVPYTQLANLTGRPAMSVPLHWTPDGLPMGVQFVGPLGGEGVLFRLAAQLEQAQPWRDRWPSLG